MVIGLVGKSCSGKNLVGSLLEKRGYEVWDLDSMAHDILDEKSSEVEKAFGPSVMNQNGVNRKALSSVVFSSPEQLRKLENILYPVLTEKIIQRKNEIGNGVFVINGALLARANMDSICDFLIFVEAPYSTRLSRAKERDGISEEEFFLRDSAQKDVSPDDIVYKRPVFVIVNDSVLSFVNRQIDIVCDNMLSVYSKGNDNEEK